MAKIIALAGKGGVGKTTLCSAVVRILSENFPKERILAIDADPAVGLSVALGVETKETLDDIRREIISKAEQGEGKEAMELLGEARYRIFDALTETDGFAFLAIGRPEGAGCYCSVNNYLKEVIHMLSREFDYVVIDGEAGIEQINRRVMEKVSHLILVTDPSAKGIQVAGTIRSVADELVMYEKCGVIINRVEDMSVIPCLQIDGAEILSIVKRDEAHAKNDILGKSIFELPVTAPVYLGAKEALEKLGIIDGGKAE
ncbi:MAG: AAA family ATPase [Blautia sp.]|nr:AAA family ATPase [Blautia sp.]